MIERPIPFKPQEDQGYGPAAFADLWDSINAKRGYGWDGNPWVWVISYKRVSV